MVALTFRSSLHAALAALIFMMASPGSRAQPGETSQKSKQTPIGNKSGRSGRPNRPPDPNLCVQYFLKVNSDANAGELKLEAKFTNKNSTRVRFLFCQMVGFETTETEQRASCRLQYNETANKITCETTTDAFPTFSNSYHFGCKLVTIAANADTMVNYGSSGSQAKFKKKEAKNFYVTYADYVQLPAGATFDETNCPQCFGCNKTTGLGDRDLKIWGDWFLPLLAIDDPYIAWQPIGGGPVQPEYLSLSSPLSVPSNFPADVPQLPRNVPQPVPPSYIVPLNLYDVFTMAAPPSTPFPAQLTVQTSGSPQVLFSTNPPPGHPFTMFGGSEDVGNIQISHSGSLPQGTIADIDVTVHEPDGPSLGEAYFSQRGSFIHDTVPPNVLASHLTPVPGHNLHVQVSADDATTEPLSASFWYSIDGGQTWADAPLASESEIFQTLALRTFAGDVGPFLAGATIRYFFTVQDGVYNTTFYGMGQTTFTPSETTYLPQSALRTYPNPFRSSARIGFNLAEKGRAQIEIYDISGRLVRRIVQQDLPAGGQFVTWDGDDEHGQPVAEGMYVIKVSAGGIERREKVMRVR